MWCATCTCAVVGVSVRACRAVADDEATKGQKQGLAAVLNGPAGGVLVRRPAGRREEGAGGREGGRRREGSRREVSKSNLWGGEVIR